MKYCSEQKGTKIENKCYERPSLYCSKHNAFNENVVYAYTVRNSADDDRSGSARFAVVSRAAACRRGRTLSPALCLRARARARQIPRLAPPRGGRRRSWTRGQALKPSRLKKLFCHWQRELFSLHIMTPGSVSPSLSLSTSPHLTSPPAASVWTWRKVPVVAVTGVQVATCCTVNVRLRGPRNKKKPYPPWTHVCLCLLSPRCF